MLTWKCPQCGEDNPEKARLCGLCGEMRPEEKPQEIIARHLAPSPTPAPSLAARVAVPNSQQWRAPVHEEVTAAEKRRMAEEAAAQITGRSPAQSRDAIGCGTWLLFAAFFPWSLMVLPMPGGVRNKKAGKVLLIIAVVVLILGAISAAALLRHLMPVVTNMGDQYKDALGGQ